jgi:hypothetical protein
VQPGQLSLLPDQIPPPAPMVLAHLPEADVAEAISLLGALIAKASTSTPGARAEAEEVRTSE